MGCTLARDRGGRRVRVRLEWKSAMGYRKRGVFKETGKKSKRGLRVPRKQLGVVRGCMGSRLGRSGLEDSDCLRVTVCWGGMRALQGI